MTRYIVLLWDKFVRAYVPLHTFFGVAICTRSEQDCIRSEYPNAIFQPCNTPDW